MQKVLSIAIAVAFVGAAAIPAKSEAQGQAVASGAGSILRVDPRLDTLVPADARIEKIADGFVFLEGPVWIRDESRLLYSDLRGNAIYQWTEAEGASDYLNPFFAGDGTGLRGVGPNGVALDTEGRLVVCVYGSRSVTRLEADGTRTVLADRYEGRRLNSPNDLVVGSDGSLYFTDPPFGLEGFDNSPLRELDFNGVYRLRPDGELELLTRNQARPNGIALSPDESILYVANSGGEVTGWMAYDLGPDGVSNARVFYDITGVEGPGGADGMKVDLAGNVFATGPGGVWVFSPDGTHLGTIQPDEALTNVGWGDDGRTLYITGRTSLFRVRLSTAGQISQ
ncbi:SMP-30/gluconolactonase/LRE family protein [Candidatus Rariloculus sp.]|uniref:SMP-30/gluconolactonase/LRE family protein n=1 Tax=Candidatus Rariloculus sp. TaxID=3101265 RepID=UPI003D122307